MLLFIPRVFVTKAEMKLVQKTEKEGSQGWREFPGSCRSTSHNSDLEGLVDLFASWEPSVQ